MRRPRDFDTELKALGDKAKALKERKVVQLGDLVIATGADALDADELAGALLAAASEKSPATKEGWRKAGAAFFQGQGRTRAGAARNAAPGAQAEGAAQPAGAGKGAE